MIRKTQYYSKIKHIQLFIFIFLYSDAPLIYQNYPCCKSYVSMTYFDSLMDAYCKGLDLFLILLLNRLLRLVFQAFTLRHKKSSCYYEISDVVFLKILAVIRLFTVILMKIVIFFTLKLTALFFKWGLISQWQDFSYLSECFDY